jgi:hypothetical protein
VRQVVALLTDQVRSRPDARRVVATVDPRTDASVRTLRSNGFVLGDADRDRYVLERAGTARRSSVRRRSVPSDRDAPPVRRDATQHGHHRRMVRHLATGPLLA